ncbi:MAG TPA: hypothetical protein VNO86_03165 [Candidatus Binatia bacterium]|nr:hypothetical protein [Candidatus Binatia bacterium]
MITCSNPLCDHPADRGPAIIDPHGCRFAFCGIRCLLTWGHLLHLAIRVATDPRLADDSEPALLRAAERRRGEKTGGQHEP